ncbi:hypothetical protein [Rhodopirellula sp. MGV]|uniref:hypothetical protein n=1 Tax=Rhodopirellula sp. MGV TaxID=2023130 RepID=UPI000B975D4B|nr:hypothetical protein [Rhodopirellula sp. MGV]OYP34732.1 hypothetical protein CGZ80_13970 [Rhodopirellula sp. MGV]PNY34313.1 hypothetical protein C2E31_24085 [Rhodopirellula baltica]
MKMQWWSSCVSVAVVTSVLFVSGCGKIAKKAAEQAIESELEKDGGTADFDLTEDGFSAEVDGVDGKAQYAIGASAKVPADWPSDIPVFDGLKLNMSHANKDQGTFVIQGNSTAGFQEVIDFYAAAAAKEGWKEESVSKQGDSMWIQGLSKDGRMLTIMVAASDEGTSVTQTTNSND